MESTRCRRCGRIFFTEKQNGGIKLLKTIYNGKTKTVLADDGTGSVYLFFKDDATGEDVFDPALIPSEARLKKDRAEDLAAFSNCLRAAAFQHYLGADVKGLMQVGAHGTEANSFLRCFTAGHVPPVLPHRAS